MAQDKIGALQKDYLCRVDIERRELQFSLEMHRFYLPPEACTGSTLTLDDRESHHATDVLRIREGEIVTVLDGVGHEFRCAVRSARRKAVMVEVQEKNTFDPEPFSLTLVQAVPKGKMIEFIIQKATELGATAVCPILTDRVATHLDEEGAEHKAEKWRQVAIEAIKQCGQKWLPDVGAPVKLHEYLAKAAPVELAMVGALQPGSRHPHSHFNLFRSKHGRGPGSVSVWVGPEGDFTPEEMARICESGVLPVSFGPLVLRSETAALYALSVASYELRLPQI